MGHAEHEGRGILTNFLETLAPINTMDKQEPYA